MSVPRPNLTLTITPPGGSPTNYTQYMAYDGANQQLTITQNFGRQGDTATIALVDEYATTPHILIKVQSQIKLVDNAIGVTLFAGVVDDPSLMITGPNRNEWTLQCTDYTYYADNSQPITGQFIGLTTDEIVVELTQQADCGVTAATVADGGFVAPGPQLPSVSIPYSSLSAAWRTIAQLAGQVTPYGWYVDENRALHFYDATSAQDSGVTFTTTPTVAGSATEGHIGLDDQNTYEWDGTSIHNLILVQGANQTIYSPVSGNPTDTFRADSVASQWPLRYTVDFIDQLKVGGSTVTATMVEAGATPTGVWNVIQNANGAWFLTTTNPPGAGVLIKIWYDYEVPVVAQAQDTNSQATYSGPNRGVFGEFVSDQSLLTTSMALARAQRERQEYGFAVERATFSTTEDWIGWVRSGQVFQYINRFIPDAQAGYSIGINDDFLAIQNTVTFGEGGYRTMLMTGVRI